MGAARTYFEKWGLGRKGTENILKINYEFGIKIWNITFFFFFFFLF
jgi:hypothetical protein